MTYTPTTADLRRLRRIALCAGCPESDAEDAVQNAFLAYLEAKVPVEKPWLFLVKATVRQAWTFRRKSQVRRGPDLRDDDAAVAPEQEARVLEHEAPLTSRLAGGESRREIADSLGISRRGVDRLLEVEKGRLGG